MKRKVLIPFLAFTACLVLGMFFHDTRILAAQESTENEADDIIIPYEDSLHYDDIQSAIDDMQISDSNGSVFHFGDYVKGLITGKNSFSPKAILADTEELFLGQLKKEKKSIVQLVAISIIAAVFTSFTNVFKDSQIAETGFYVTYLLLFTLLTATFCKISQAAGQALFSLLEFMRALLPTYFVGITFCTGGKTSMVFYETTLFIITMVDVVMIKILLPLIDAYFILVLANNIMKKDMLSKTADLLKTIISWSLKTLLGAVIGFNVIQGLIFPIADQVKKSAILRTAHSIPGVGNAIGSVTESVFAAGILIKNAIGAAGLIIIISICLVPIIKLAIYQLIYKFGAAIVQPVSDKRVLNCINATAQSAKLLMNLVLIGAVLFLFSIVIITASTGVTISM